MPTIIFDYVRDALRVLSGFWDGTKSGIPTADQLTRDIKRLEKIQSLHTFRTKEFPLDYVKTYYKSTSFRDYNTFAKITGCNAMHTRLRQRGPVPYDAGFLQQLMHVIAHMPATRTRMSIVEIGSGKGSNLLYLAKLLPPMQASLIGVDLVDLHVEYSKKYTANMDLISNTNCSNTVNFVQADCSRLNNFPAEKTIDLIFGIESLCHLDSDDAFVRFLKSAAYMTRPGARFVVIDGFRSKAFDSLSTAVQDAMQLAEGGLRCRQMRSKESFRELAALNGFKLLYDVDLTHEAIPFWTLGWRVACLILLLIPSWILRWYFSASRATAETHANFVAVMMTAYAMVLGSAEYGLLVFERV